MENIFDNIRDEMLRLIELSNLIGKYDEMLLHHLNMEDKGNYNPKKCNKIKEKLGVLNEEFYYLKNKWV